MVTPGSGYVDQTGAFCMGMIGTPAVYFGIKLKTYLGCVCIHAYVCAYTYIGSPAVYFGIKLKTYLGCVCIHVHV
jgi:hypothetical protein